ncbi:MAG: hypothetical protein HYZ83_02695 [Candidatus Omnitrophica bacterium]|nr:hypothetical protein [Candidatus Omnitrophota bacterium]
MPFNQMKLSLFKKVPAIFILSTFLINVAQPPLVANSPKAYEAISIPERFGKIEESFSGKSDKTIIYIQDAHDSLEAQENIAKIIGYLVEHYGVKTVFEEGYEGTVPTDQYFSFIKDPALKEKISYFLMDKLRLGGAEYAHVNRKKDFNLIGADSIKLHLENIKQYQRSAKHKAETQKELDAISREIKRLADQHFPKELKEWMKLKERFDDGKLDLLTYLKRMAALNPSLAIPTHINLLLRAESEKDQKAIQIAKEMDSKILFREIDLLENRIADHFLKNKRDRRVFQHYKSVGLLRRLSDIRLSHDEYELVKTTLRELNTENFARSIVEMTGKSIVLSKRWEQNIQNAMRFYEIAETRDQLVIRSLDTFLASPDEKLAVMVFGGFHKHRLQEILKRKHISYVTMSPKITAISEVHQRYYQELMSVGRLSFEPPSYVRTAAPAGRAVEVIADPRSYLLEMSVFPQELKEAIRSEMRNEFKLKNIHLTKLGEKNVSAYGVNSLVISSIWKMVRDGLNLELPLKEPAFSIADKFAFIDRSWKIEITQRKDDQKIIDVHIYLNTGTGSDPAASANVLGADVAQLINRFKADLSLVSVFELALRSIYKDRSPNEDFFKEILFSNFGQDRKGRLPYDVGFEGQEIKIDRDFMMLIIRKRKDLETAAREIYSNSLSAFGVTSSEEFSVLIERWRKMKGPIAENQELLDSLIRTYRDNITAQAVADEQDKQARARTLQEQKRKPFGGGDFGINDFNLPKWAKGFEILTNLEAKVIYAIATDDFGIYFGKPKKNSLYQDHVDHFFGVFNAKQRDVWNIEALFENYFLDGVHIAWSKLNEPKQQEQMRQLVAWRKAFYSLSNKLLYAAGRAPLVELRELVPNTGGHRYIYRVPIKDLYLIYFDEKTFAKNMGLIALFKEERLWLLDHKGNPQEWSPLLHDGETISVSGFGTKQQILSNATITRRGDKLDFEMPESSSLGSIFISQKIKPRRSEVRQSSPIAINADFLKLISKSQDIPASLFFDYNEIKEKTGSLRKGLLALSHLTQGSKLKLVIHSADRTDLELKEFRDLGVEVTQGGLEKAFGAFGEKFNGRNVNASTKAEFLKKQLASLSGLKLKHILVQDESEIWAAYLRAITNPDQPVPGLADSHGYYEVVGEFLRSELRSYQASLVIEMAA